MATANDIVLDAKNGAQRMLDDPREDLRSGFAISANVRFDADPEEWGQMTILQKGANEPGAYILRVDGPKEGVKFSFFVNTDGSPEPRISLPIKPVPGRWYPVKAGWDGTNAWLEVEGRRACRSRLGAKAHYPLMRRPQIGPMRGVVRDLRVSAPLPAPKDTTIRPGFRIACNAVFHAEPKGECTLISKKNEYWLRYDERDGAFNLFVNINGGWEPRVSVAKPIELGRVYSITGGWNGREVSMSVDGDESQPARRQGQCGPGGGSLSFGDRRVVEISDFAIRNESLVIASFGLFRTRELMPTLGTPATLTVNLLNIGADAGACTVTAVGRDGVKVEPAKVDIPALSARTEIPLAWTINPGTNGLAYVDFEVKSGDKSICRAWKRVVFMPEKMPDYSAKVWSPEIRPRRTYYVDSARGSDARDGRSPETAWKTFANVAELEFGPGDRLLLKRGSVFREELFLKAVKGSADNWAEIGAYGEGMRPQIARNRHINDRCAYVKDSAYLVVRDLIFCNAGAGLMVGCNTPESGHVLVERCLAHHIEGTYRHNSHGIPEWRDEPGPGGGARSYGIAVIGSRPNHIVMRDCESYQCSSGFRVNGVDTFVNRMFCHDNYAHNTSPHPYNLASRSWITDCVFDASGWHAAAGTMGIMLANNDGWIIKGCHFLNQPDSGSPDQGGIDFEAQGENCLVEDCTFRNNAGAAIEVLGLRSPQTRNVQIRGCRFDRNNWSFKNGPAEIQVWGGPDTSPEVACSNGRIENNGYVLVPGVPFYVNHTCTSNDWTLANNREFDFAEELDAAFPYPDPPKIDVCGEVWTDRPEVALSAKIDDAKAKVEWEQIEGPAGAVFDRRESACTKVRLPGEGDYRVNVKADNGTLWRAAHTAVHVLPEGARTYYAWNFAKNLDSQGWQVEEAGTEYEFIPGQIAFWNTESFPVRMVCGDYYVIAVKDSGKASIVTPCDRDVGVEFSRTRANAVRVKLQNHTTSAAMRLWWQTDAAPTWDERRSVLFHVEPDSVDDRVYTVPMPQAGGIKQFRLAFSADGSPITGTVRIDYIWCGRLPE